MKIKARILILKFRLASVIDVLFSDNFSLVTYYKDGNSKYKTRFKKQEILDNV